MNIPIPTSTPHQHTGQATRRLPAEFEPQRAILLTWPHARGDFGTILPTVETTFLALAYHISETTALIISCFDNDNLNHVQKMLFEGKVNLPNCHLTVAPSNDIWARDHGPITVFEDDKPHLLDFQFNGWGGKYPHKLDNELTGVLAQKHGLFNLPISKKDFVLEGGSIESDGQDTILTTSRCLLNPSRNGRLNKGQIEAIFQENFGTKQILWLESGALEGDDTDGHIDMLARFVSQNTILYTTENDETSPNYTPLKQMLTELKAFRTLSNEPYCLVPLPSPEPLLMEDGQRLPTTYANFLIVNDKVLLPQFNEPNDKIACDTLQHCFPNKKIIGIDSSALMTQFGGLHCATMGIF